MPGELRVVGAGLGRTGTNSLKVALEYLLGGPCYHMFELLEHREQLPGWLAAVQGEGVDWRKLLDGYLATVDWPACAYWRQFAAAYPDAVVLLSSRDAASWWESMNATIIPVLDWEGPDGDPDFERGQRMIKDLISSTLTPDWRDRDALIEAFERHNANVRAEIAPGRLVEWQPGEGWEPICAGLGIVVPDAPFPHENASGDFTANLEHHLDVGREA